MAMQDEVAMVDSTVEEGAVVQQEFGLAVQEVKRCLQISGESFSRICTDIETATSRPLIKAAFRRLNSVTQIFLRLAPADTYKAQIVKALCELEASPRLRTFLQDAASVEEAIKAYKSSVLQDLAVIISRDQEANRVDDEKDDELFSLILPSPSPEPDAQVPAKKRAIANVDDLLMRIPKRSKIPALASLHLVPGGGADGQAAKKTVLVTRQKLRAAQLDPKGLLNLVEASTNALERAKQLEMLKTSGWLQKSDHRKTFTDRLHDATVRVDLGLAGHMARDTLVFGQKVMSAPGFLSAKNISDIQNGNVEGKTTWKHQHAYAKMTIAGAINQAKRIVQKFDTVLHGAKPEVLVEETHKAIRGILQSKEGREFIRDLDSTEAAKVSARDKVVMRIVEAVAPIIPLTIRDKALDGGYLRTALQFLGAAEFMFTQYEGDIRTQANPNGVVGLTSAMHNEFERALLFNDHLKPLQEFMSEMKQQYQTSLGLGAPFLKDFGGRTRQRENRRSRNRSSYSTDRFRFSSSSGRPQDQQEQSGAGLGVNTLPIRGRPPCYAFREGTCRRGAMCRFSHVAN